MAPPSHLTAHPERVSGRRARIVEEYGAGVYEAVITTLAERR